MLENTEKIVVRGNPHDFLPFKIHIFMIYNGHKDLQLQNLQKFYCA